ncbi:nitrous oxide-stimulated promoter family protein [Escherichia coli]
MSGKRISREKLTIKKIKINFIKRNARRRQRSRSITRRCLFTRKSGWINVCSAKKKPACKQCPVHCYQPAKREEMKQIMRWAGPRMLWRHPILTVRHTHR